MGNCCSVKPQATNRLQNVDMVEILYDDIKEGDHFNQNVVESLNEEDLNKKLDFEINMGHFKIQKLARNRKFYLDFRFVDEDPSASQQAEIRPDGVRREELHCFKMPIVPKPTAQVFWKSEDIRFSHHASINQLKRQFLEVRFRNILFKESEKDVEKEYSEQEIQELEESAMTLSVYRVDFLTLALGPVHHSIEMVRKHISPIPGMKPRSRYLCRFSCDIHFVQSQKVEVQLYKMNTVFKEKRLDQAYQCNFNVITFNGVNESTKSNIQEPHKFMEQMSLSKSLRKKKLNLEPYHSELTWNYENPVVNEVKHHLDDPEIFENSFKSQKETQTEIENQVPYCVFTMSMAKIKDASIQLKIWEDSNYKTERRRERMVSTGQSEYIKNRLQSQRTMRDSSRLKGELLPIKSQFAPNAPPQAKIGDQKIPNGQFETEDSIKTEGDQHKRNIDFMKTDAAPAMIQPGAGMKRGARLELSPGGDDPDPEIESLASSMMGSLMGSKKLTMSQIQIELPPQGQRKPSRESLLTSGSKEYKLLQLRKADSSPGTAQRKLSERVNLELDAINTFGKSHNIQRKPSLTEESAEEQVFLNVSGRDATDVYKTNAPSPYFWKKARTVNISNKSPSVAANNRISDDIAKYFKGIAAEPDLYINEKRSSSPRSIGKNEGLEHLEHMVGECYIAFERLMDDFNQQDYKGDQGDEEVVRKRTIKLINEVFDECQLVKNTKTEFSQFKLFEEKLMLCGQQVGVCQGSFRIFNLPFLSQMKIGVMRNQGVEFSSKPLMFELANIVSLKANNSKEDKSKELQLITQKLIKHDRHVQRIPMSDLYDHILLIIDLLKSSQKESMRSFIYHSEAHLIKAQTALIQLGLHCLEFCDFISELFRENYYQILTLVLERAELDLGQMKIFLGGNISRGSQSRRASAILPKYVSQKQTVAANYQFFIFSVLQKCIRNLNLRGVEVYKRRFIEQGIAMSFFRIPEFADYIINGMTQRYKVDENDDKNESGSVNSEELGLGGTEIYNKNTTNQDIHALFDWQKYLYDCIPEEQQKKSKELLKEIIRPDAEEQLGWEERITKRGSAFFLIIKSWASYVKRTLVKTDGIVWADIPGYKSLVKIMLQEFREQNIHYYSDALKEASLSFLINEKLLSPLVVTVFKKTNMFDSVAVIQTLELMVRWFVRVQTQQDIIPSNFDFSFFLTGIQKLLEMDHGTQTAKVIWFLYQVCHIIPQRQRDMLLGYLLEPARFYSFFYNWSWTIRMTFFYFYFFQLHLFMIRDKDAQDDLHKSVTASLRDIQVDQMKLSQKDTKSNQPVKEVKFGAGPAKDDEAEEDPQEGNFSAQLRFANPLTQSTKLTSNRMIESRLNQSDSRKTVFKKFQQRMEEIESMKRLCSLIKGYMKQHKQKLTLERAEDSKKIQALVQKARKSGQERQDYSFSYAMSDRPLETDGILSSQDTEHDAFDDVQSYHKELKQLRTRIADLNVCHYAYAVIKPDGTLSIPQPGSDRKEEGRSILSENQQKRWSEIIEKIPQENRVYITQSFGQIKSINKEYNDWLDKSQSLEFQLEIESKPKDEQWSAQGLNCKPNFPTVQVRVHEDPNEMEAMGDDW